MVFLKECKTGELVEVLDPAALYDPFASEIIGRYNIGEEMPEPRAFAKSDLAFCSNEQLPGAGWTRTTGATKSAAPALKADAVTCRVDCQCGPPERRFTGQRAPCTAVAAYVRPASRRVHCG